MKKLLLALALMLPMVVFTACEKENDNEPGNNNEIGLVGTWAGTSESGVTTYLQFNADHTGSKWIEYQEEIYYPSSCTWSTNKNILTIVFREDGEIEEQSVRYSVDRDKLTFFDEEYTVIYDRVK